MILGEAGIDAGGLWLDDRDQGWRFRAGNIRNELLYDAAESGNRRAVDSLGRSGPVWGLHVSRKF